MFPIKATNCIRHVLDFFKLFGHGSFRAAYISSLSDIILLTVAIPILSERPNDCCESSVARKHNMRAGLHSEETNIRKLMSFFSVSGLTGPDE